MHVAIVEESRSSFNILAIKPTKQRHLGRPRGRRDDSIIVDLEEMSE